MKMPTARPQSKPGTQSAPLWLAAGNTDAGHTWTRMASVCLVACVVVALMPTPAFALPYQCGGWANWSDGTKITTAYANRGDMYAYARPSTGVKVNSIYVMAPGDPFRYLVEVGYTSTGSNAPDLPDNENPWFFAATKKAGVYGADDWFNLHLPVGERTTVGLQNTTGSETWEAYYETTLKRRWYDRDFDYGMLMVGEERSNTSIDARASITNMRRMDASYDWYYWWHGYKFQEDELYQFRFNHVGDSNHWVYCDDHWN